MQINKLDKLIIECDKKRFVPQLIFLYSEYQIVVLWKVNGQKQILETFLVPSILKKNIPMHPSISLRVEFECSAGERRPPTQVLHL